MTTARPTALLCLAALLASGCEGLRPEGAEGTVVLAGPWEWVAAPSGESDRPPAAGAAWGRSTELPAGRPIWYRQRLPRRLPPEPSLVFRAYVDQLSIFVGDARVYAFSDPAAGERLSLHLAPLPAGAAGKWLYLRVPPRRRPPYFGQTIAVAPAASVPLALVRGIGEPLWADLDDVVIGGALLVLGLLSLGTSLLRRRRRDRLLLDFGAFAALYGLRLVLGSFLPRLVPLPAAGVEQASAFITYLINVPGWALARELIGDGWRSSLRWQLRVFVLFAPLGIVADLASGTPGSLEDVNRVLVVVGGANVLANLVAARRRRSVELPVVLSGAIVFMLFALNENLVGLGVLPWDWGDETLGFVVFVGTLGYAALRSFVTAERHLAALEGELTTARQIQRSLLPERMPEVAGLRFAVRYEAASTVAGDLYDFLPIDAHRLGVVVADVSGHGVPAALVAAMVKVVLSSQAGVADRPARLLHELNRTLCGEIHHSFVTATYLCFDMEAHRVEVANAGHPPPLLLRRASGELTELGRQGLLLGRFPEATYTSAPQPLAAGDRIVIYTDGIVEARNAHGEAFGEERLKQLIRQHGAAPAESLADAVLTAVRRWRGKGALGDSDDLTLVVVEVGGVAG